MMLKVEAIVREEKFEDVKSALDAISVNGLTVSQVMGCGVQRGYKEVVRGVEVDLKMRPKIKFEIVVSSEEWAEKTIDAIQKAAYTGEPGDGKIFCYEIKSALKIRTGETGYDAIQATNSGAWAKSEQTEARGFRRGPLVTRSGTAPSSG